MILLQTLNKYLRWTGFRCSIGYEQPDANEGPLHIGLRWFGWGFLRDGTLFKSDAWVWAETDGAWAWKRQELLEQHVQKLAAEGILLPTR